MMVKNDVDDDYAFVNGTSGSVRLFPGNSQASVDDKDLVVENEFDWPVAARFVRLHPQTWIRAVSLRWELYGCDDLAV